MIVPSEQTVYKKGSTLRVRSKGTAYKSVIALKGCPYRTQKNNRLDYKQFVHTGQFLYLSFTLY